VTERPTPEEQEVYFGPQGPVEAAKRWLEDIVARRDVAAAWRRTDPDYRLALAQAVIFLNQENPHLAYADRAALARELAEEDAIHPLWKAFADLLTEEFLHDLGEINVANWGRVTPRPIAPGYELVLFARDDVPTSDYPPEMTSHGVLMHHREERWLVAGLSERPAVPGWPPDLGY
jgi:hypothetical protein